MAELCHMTIVIRSGFHKDSKYYSQVFLGEGECVCKL